MGGGMLGGVRDCAIFIYHVGSGFGWGVWVYESEMKWKEDFCRTSMCCFMLGDDGPIVLYVR